MLLVVKCPSCKNEVKVPATSAMATCPKCVTTFRADATEEDQETEAIETRETEATVPSAPALPEEDETIDEGPSWISPWGTVTWIVAVLAVFQAAVLGFWWLTICLAIVGIGLLGSGIWATAGNRRLRDWVWFALGGGLCIAVLVVSLAMPGLMNRQWAIDTAAPRVDPDAPVIVGRDMALEEGKRASADDWADALTHAIRQEDLLVRVESVKIGTLPGKGDTSYFLIHLRLANCKQLQTITVDGFQSEPNRPTLTSESGRSHAFVEQRLRKRAKGPAVFEASARAVDLSTGDSLAGSGDRQDYLLVFASPPGLFEPVKLEVSASAWGRKGTCRFRIPRSFDSTVSKKL